MVLMKCRKDAVLYSGIEFTKCCDNPKLNMVETSTEGLHGIFIDKYVFSCQNCGESLWGVGCNNKTTQIQNIAVTWNKPSNP